MRRVVAYLAVRLRRLDRTQRCAACPDDELADAMHRIGRAIGRLRREALVVVLVAVDYHVRAERVEDAPDLLHMGIVAVIPGAKDWVVPIGQRADGSVGG